MTVWCDDRVMWWPCDVMTVWRDVRCLRGKTKEREEEAEDEDVETKYLSDYEPDSSDSGEPSFSEPIFSEPSCAALVLMSRVCGSNSL